MRRSPIPEIAEPAPISVQGTPLDPGQPEFWLSLLVHRKYGDLAQPSWPEQFSTRIEHRGIAAYFPLGSNDRLGAARRAVEIYESVATQGWSASFLRFPREITLSIFWRRHPVACTYTTLYTERPSKHEARSVAVTPLQSRLKRVLVIEPDAGLRTTLQRWLARLPHCVSAGTFANAGQAFRSPHFSRIDLCLFNQHLPDLSEQEVLRRMHSLRAGLPAYSFGIYEQSDDIFATMSGVEKGYFLRRRPPVEMLDPILVPWREGALSRADLDQGITRYFQNLFLLPDSELDSPESSRLTSREQEVLNCLRKGFPDKQIAEALAIRPSTVHTHLKKIFEKLAVHTRTEAVMKYLQK